MTCKCGTFFEPIRSNQIRCSPKCTEYKKEKLEKQNKLRNSLKLSIDRYCTICGTSINHRRKDSKTCGRKCNTISLRVKPKQKDRKCQNCSVNIDNKHLSAKYCSDKCRIDANNKYKSSPMVQKECLICKSSFETRKGNMCSNKCMNIYARYKTDIKTIQCIICDKEIITGSKVIKKTCSTNCSDKLKEMQKSPVKTGLKKSKKINKKVISKKKIISKAKLVKEQTKKVHIPTFACEPEPIITPKDKLATIFRNHRLKKEKSGNDCIAQLQAKYLKKNKVTIIENVPVKYVKYQGKELPINTLTEVGVTNHKSGVFFERGNKEYT